MKADDGYKRRMWLEPPPLLKMAIIEIVSFPIKHGDFPLLCERLPEGTRPFELSIQIKSGNPERKCEAPGHDSVQLVRL